MYTSWKHLILKNEHELKDRARLKRLYRSQALPMYFVIGGFSLGGVTCIFASFPLFAMSIQANGFHLGLLIGGLFVLIFSLVFFGAGWMFKKNLDMDLLRNYFRDPEKFEFIKGKLTSAHFSSTGEKASIRMMVKGEGVYNGKKILVSEDFRPSIWPFTDIESEESLRPGDDWYDMKGKRKVLPVDVHILVDVAGSSYGKLIGIDAGEILSALGAAEIKL